jgi:hypothetical protein
MRPSFPEDLWKVKNGKLMESQENATNYAAVEAMKEAILLCWTHDMSDRPSARTVQNRIEKALQVIDRKYHAEDVVRVQIPPLPADHRFTDSDYLEHSDFIWPANVMDFI